MSKIASSTALAKAQHRSGSLYGVSDSITHILHTMISFLSWRMARIFCFHSSAAASSATPLSYRRFRAPVCFRILKIFSKYFFAAAAALFFPCFSLAVSRRDMLYCEQRKIPLPLFFQAHDGCFIYERVVYMLDVQLFDLQSFLPLPYQEALLPG